MSSAVIFRGSRVLSSMAVSLRNIACRLHRRRDSYIICLAGGAVGNNKARYFTALPPENALEPRWIMLGRPAYATFLPQSLVEAKSAPLRIAASLSHTTGSTTHSRLVNVPKPQSVE